MDITMFFAFPGILITIGVVLLLLSIVFLIMAFKTNDTYDYENNKDNISNIDNKEDNKKENKDLNNSAAVKELVVEKEEQPIDNSQDKTSLEDGFDLTKVFEISEDKSLIEKDITSTEDNKKLDDNVADTTLEEESNINNKDDEEIELL